MNPNYNSTLLYEGLSNTTLLSKPGSILDHSESGFRASLAGAADVEFDVINALIVCLKSVGVEFSP